jgi:hypothetical protein
MLIQGPFRGAVLWSRQATLGSWLRSRSTVQARLDAGKVAVGAAVAALIVLGGMARLGDGLWALRAGGGGVRVFDGIPMAWEWIDVATTTWLFDGDPRWTSDRVIIRTDHLIRFVPGIPIALLGVWTGHAWRASILATWLCWFAAAAATYALCRALVPATARGHRIGCIAAFLVALSPGFAAYVGNIEVRPFAYAAAPLALLALERARALRPASPGIPPGTDLRQHPYLLAAVLFLANGTLELGPPLLVMLWLTYVLLDGRAGSPPLAGRVRWAAQVTLGYVALAAGWWAIGHVATLGRASVSEQNDAWYRIFDAMARERPGWSALSARLWNVQQNAIPTFTLPVVALLVPGILVLPRRAAVWAVVWIGAIVAAILLTRHWPRNLYLAYPAVYLAAAAAIDRAGALLATCLPAGAPRMRAVLLWLPASGFLYLVGRIALGDLAGDLSLVQVWWPQ